MIWLLIALGLAVAVGAIYVSRRGAHESTTGTAVLEPTERRRPVVATISITTATVPFDSSLWERERDERKRAREASIGRLRSAFVRPASLRDAVNGVKTALAELATVRGVRAPDSDALLGEARVAGTLPKIERTVRKRLNAAYKLRTDPEKLHEALACCLAHVQLALEHRDSSWKVASDLKRIVSNLDHDRYRRQAIGFLLVLGDEVRAQRPEVGASCDEEAARLFSNWWADENQQATFQADLARLETTSSASEKHFILNGLVEFLDRRRPFDPSIRPQLIALCEQDVALYKAFLVDFHRLQLRGSGRASFAQVLQLESYMCPSLPSFNILWDLFEETADLTQLRRLQKISKDIRYRSFEIDEEPEASAVVATARTREEPAREKPSSIKAEAADASAPTETIEVRKSGQGGKLAFLNSSGEACSTEDAADDHFRARGWKTLRAEVRFWQAMFALTFWEEIFANTDAPNAMNDIPFDLFSGTSFYETRRAAIDARAAIVARSDVRQLASTQLRQHGGTWTRLVFDGPRRDFSYRRVLESADAAEFLATIPAPIFAKVVHRIATNPSEHRAGVADYVMWKDGGVVFVEVKGIREKLRESQVAWIAWMLAEGIPVKVVRVKGVAALKGASSSPEGE